MRWKARRVGKGPTVSHRAVRRAAGNIVEEAKRRAQPFDDILRLRGVRGPRPVHRTVTRAFTGAVIALAFAFTIAFELAAEIPYFMEPHAGVSGLPIGMGLFCLCTAAVAVCAAQRGGAVKQTPGRAVDAVAMVLDVVYDVLHMVTTRRHAGQRSEGSLHTRKV
ncbi:hypothetical protein [Streptomyces globosus]|uniref:hypothetical protein n=1 Tax=Streptomyces globosus TaxID=68209 RepID=UPI0013B3C658|nr:hypothetical protein [Streptomyces globosus]